MVDRADRLVWIDLETTGFEPGTSAPGNHSIMEIAVVVTEADLTEVAAMAWQIWQTPCSLSKMEPIVRAMHEASGLVASCIAADRSLTVDDVANNVLEFLKKHVDPQTSPLCGNSVWFDHGFLVRDMPAVRAHLHYRIVDVSTVKELVRRWRSDVTEPKKKLVHRALDDLRETVAEATLYRDMIFARSDPNCGLGERQMMAS